MKGQFIKWKKIFVNYLYNKLLYKYIMLKVILMNNKKNLIKNE